MLADPERYDDTDGRATFRVTVGEHGFTASVLLKDCTWEDFAVSSSMATFIEVMQTICNAKVAGPEARFVYVGRDGPPH